MVLPQLDDQNNVRWFPKNEIMKNIHLIVPINRCITVNLAVQQVKQILESWHLVRATYLAPRGSKLTWVAAAPANHILSGWGSLKLLLMAFVWRRGGLGSVRLLISNKQKVTSLKNWTIWPPDWFCGIGSSMNYVGCVTGACWAAFERTRQWFFNISGW